MAIIYASSDTEGRMERMIRTRDPSIKLLTFDDVLFVIAAAVASTPPPTPFLSLWVTTTILSLVLGSCRTDL